jgi:DNA-binding YbaB/EbfC family protein
MFKELGQMASLLKQLPKIKEEMAGLQQRLGQITADGDAGAGTVKVRANGRMEIVSCQLGPDALADRELLEEMFVAAANQALDRARQQVSEETTRMATSLGLPPGLNIPGLGGGG